MAANYLTKYGKTSPQILSAVLPISELGTPVVFCMILVEELNEKVKNLTQRSIKMQKIATWNDGHGEAILSLDVNDSGILASGGEDCLCVWTSEGVLMNKISPPRAESTDVTSVCFCRRNENRLFVSLETKVFNYDLRSLGSPVCEFQFNEDEINQLVIHDGGQYLAACDDTGAVKVIDTRQNKLFKTLNRGHSNICSTVQFRPQRPWDLVTGGMDYKVVYWDFSSGRVLQDEDMQKGVETGAYFLNPPFVHSLHVKASDSRSFAAGLGDGSIQLFHFEGRKKFIVDQKIKAHTQGVSQVHFPKFKPSENILISGGNDEKIILWNFGLFNDGQKTNGNDTSVSEQEANPTGSPNCTIQHGSKVNWITSCSEQKNLVFVADQTNQISVYEVC